jgi:hypothetical protein
MTGHRPFRDLRKRLQKPEEIAGVIVATWPDTPAPSNTVAGAAMYSLIMCLREGNLIVDAPKVAALVAVADAARRAVDAQEPWSTDDLSDLEAALNELDVPSGEQGREQS